MSRQLRFLVALILVLSVPAWTLAQRRAKAKRVAPPQFDETEAKKHFFPDVFAILEGERPDPNKTPVNPDDTPGPGPDPTPGPTVVEGWAKVIAAEAIEDEIKAIKTTMVKSVTTPGDFRGRGFKVARRELTVAATLFGIINEYDGEVRFKDNASGLRDVFRTAKNCKVGTTQVYNEAKLRKEELEEIVGGAKYQGKAGDPDLTWEKICDRSPLMQRLEIAHQGRLQPATSSDSEFEKNKDSVLREAQLVAAIATVLMKEPLEDAGDEGYDDFCKEMSAAAAEIATAVKQDNYGAARAAVGKIGLACTNCHENYKG